MSDATDTIVLIHGLWMTPRSWERWAARYASRGYKVLAPAWPGLEAEVESLRRDPTPLKRLNLAQVVGHYEQLIRGLDGPPIIMGHSIGGTITQLLLDRGLGAAGVGVASGTVKGVRDLPLSTLRSSGPVLGNPLNRGKATPLSAKQFHYAFGNTLRRCCSSPSARTTSSPPRPAATTPRSTTPRRRSSPSKCFPAARTSPARPAGKRSPISPCPGRLQTRCPTARSRPRSAVSPTPPHRST